MIYNFQNVKISLGYESFNTNDMSVIRVFINIICNPLLTYNSSTGSYKTLSHDFDIS